MKRPTTIRALLPLRAVGPTLVLATGALVLLVEPALWLAGTWLDPTWDSDGGWVALACIALVARALLSGPAVPDPRGARRAVGLLFATAAVRLVGRLLAINVVGALALVVDVAALGLALGLARRPWPVRPAALAALFAFALPLEPILQRTLGYPLRLLSTVVAQAVLAPFADVVRTGTLIVTDGATLAVDLPCSGARGLTLLAALLAGLACRRRPGLPGLALAALAVPAGALAANTLRIVAVYGGVEADLPVLAEPWHGLLGLVALAVGSLPLLAVARRWPARQAPHPIDAYGWEPGRPARPGADGWERGRPEAVAKGPARRRHRPSALFWGIERRRSYRREKRGRRGSTRGGTRWEADFVRCPFIRIDSARPLSAFSASSAVSPVRHGYRTKRQPRPARLGELGRAALGLAGLAVAVLLVPSRPLDVSGSVAPLYLPTSLGPWRGEATPLDDAERLYFERFGGRVAKSVYRDGAGPPRHVIVVRTSSPLRHLHAPDRCLVGAGHDVRRVGVRPGSAPSAFGRRAPSVVWRSVDPDGRAWRVEASFLGPRGEAAATVSEVVWRWLRDPAGAWTLVERISPWEACPADPAGCARFESALLASLDVSLEVSP